MVSLIRQRGVTNEKVLAAMQQVPREQFVEPALRHSAHSDHPLPIGEGQTISQPLIVAMMTEALALSEGSTVLEVGSGCGYQAAVLAEMCPRGKVYSVERIASLSASASALVHALGYTNTEFLCADGHLGWPARAPFDRIIVTAGAATVPPALIEQLVVGGILVIPAHTANTSALAADVQEMLKITKITAGGTVVTESLGGCRFVPLIKD